jgi:hypothetical protein
MVEAEKREVRRASRGRDRFRAKVRRYGRVRGSGGLYVGLIKFKL